MAVIRSGSSTNSLSVGTNGAMRITPYDSNGEEIFRSPVNSYQLGFDVIFTAAGTNRIPLIIINNSPARVVEIRRIHFHFVNYSDISAAGNFNIDIARASINRIASAPDVTLRPRDTTRDSGSSSACRVYTSATGNSFSDSSYFTYLDREPVIMRLTAPRSGRTGQTDVSFGIEDAWSNGLFLNYRECLSFTNLNTTQIGLCGMVHVAEYDL